MYYIIRYAVFIILAVVVFLIMKKQGRLNKKTVIGSIIAAIVLCGVSDLVPVENLFVKFPTAESVYKYVSMGNARYTADGDKTAFVMGSNMMNKKSNEWYIVSKDDESYKINVGNDKLSISMIDGCSISLITDKKTKDSYAIITSNDIGQLRLNDNHNSNFKKTSFSPIFGYEYIVYLGVLDDDYRITINENTYKMDDLNKNIFQMILVENEI